MATRGAAMWKSSRFMGQGHVCNPLPNSLTSPVKQATPPPHREPQIPSVQYLVPCWGPALTTGQLPIHRAVLRSSPPQGILQEAPLSLTKPSYYPTPRELPPCPLTCNPSESELVSGWTHGPHQPHLMWGALQLTPQKPSGPRSAPLLLLPPKPLMPPEDRAWVSSVYHCTSHVYSF